MEELRVLLKSIFNIQPRTQLILRLIAGLQGKDYTGLWISQGDSI